MDWAMLIRRVRRHRLMTQSELATALQVSQGTVSRWEAGQFEPELRYQTILRDFLRANRPDLETRLLQSVRRSPFHVALAELDARLIAVSPRLQRLLEIEVSPDNPYDYGLQRMSPGARKVLAREDLRAWIFDVASISFISGITTPSGARYAMREVVTPFLLEGTHTVLRAELELLGEDIEDSSLFEDEPPIEVVYLDEMAS
jgi:transcriptional regulator with XRE-family HTH domain